MIGEKFSFSTISDFDNHISNSIFGYNVLHSLIINVSSFFIKKNVVIIDLGCTTGKLLNQINKKYDCRCIGYDIVSNNFLSTLNEGVQLIQQDITDEGFQIPKSNLIFSVFTLQFLSIEDRQKVLKKIYRSLSLNGAAIVCEKELSNNGLIQEIFTFSNYENKRKTFTEKQILDKEMDLRNLMNCVTSKENYGFFSGAGFKTIEPFFQSLNFKGYILKK